MSYVYVVYSSSVEVLNEIEKYCEVDIKKENIIFNEHVDIIPAKYAPQLEFVTSSAKFQDCKTYIKKNIDITSYKEILYDGSLNDIFVMYKNEVDAYWAIRIPLNRMVTSYYPNKNESVYKKAKFIVFLKAGDAKVLVGITDCYFQVQKLIESSCGQKIAIDTIPNDKEEHKIHSCNGVEYIVKNF